MNDRYGKWRIISFGLVISLVFSPIGVFLVEFWLFCYSFTHEMGHAFFGLLSENEYVIISLYPQSTTYFNLSSNSILAILTYLGGVIFTTILMLNMVFYLYLSFRNRKWKNKISVHLGVETIFFHSLVLILAYYSVETFSSLIPVEINGRKSDMANLLEKVLENQFVISNTSHSLLYLLFLTIFLLILIVVIVAYIVLLTNVVFCFGVFLRCKFSKNKLNKHLHKSESSLFTQQQ